MKRIFHLKLLIGAIGSFFLTSLGAATKHKELCNEYGSQIISRYSLIDIGETELDSSKLSNLSTKLTLAPLVNNSGQGIANKQNGGLVFLPTGWKYAPQINGISIHFHSINENGDLLITLTRGQDSVEWMVWPWKDGGYGSAKKHIHTVDPFKADFFFTGFNSAATTIGYKKDGDANIPTKWTLENGLKRLGEDQGIEIEGITKAINNSGAIVGVAEELTDKYPFFLSDSGLEILKQYRNFFTPKGWVEFADMVVTNNDVIYGTFWLKERPESSIEEKNTNLFYAYTWNPKTAQVEMLNLQGMRIADVNGSSILVGSLNGEAAYREPDRKAAPLASLIDPDQLIGWELYEASSINNKGQIVGYGKYNGQMHIFFASPLD